MQKSCMNTERKVKKLDGMLRSEDIFSSISVIPQILGNKSQF